MIDISDGLAMDLSRLCKASGVGAEVWGGDIPVHDNALGGRTNITPLQAALGDGEDYELLFTIPAGQAQRVCNDEHVPIKITRIGTITKEKSLVLVSADGQTGPLPRTGWQHGRA
jgi:thiamine-monophosphate kinase